MKIEKGMVAVITGAGAGMGAELSLLCAKHQADLALCDINVENLEKTKKKCEFFGVKVTTHIVDVGVRDQIKQFAKAVEKEHNGRVNLLFNNAGVASTAPFHQAKEEDFDWCFNINVNGVIDTTRAFLPMIIAQKNATIINISSVAGYYPSIATGPAYTASKFAVRGFSENLLCEARHYFPHVNVLCVHPGIIKTDILDNARELHLPYWDQLSKKGNNDLDAQEAKTHANRFYSIFGYSAEEAAVMIMDAVLTGKTRARVGWDAVIIDWWVRVFPRIMASPFDPLVPLTSIIMRKAYFPMALTGVTYYVYKSFASSKL